MTAYSLTAAVGAASLTGEAMTMNGVYGIMAFDTSTLTATLFPSIGVLLSAGVTVSAAVSMLYQAGPVANELVHAGEQLVGTMYYYPILATSMAVVSNLQAGFPVTASETATLSAAASVAWGVAVLQKLTLGDQPVPSATFLLALAEAVAIHSLLGNFIGGTVSDTVNMTTALAPLWAFSSSAADAVRLSETYANSLLINLITQDGLEFSDQEVLQMIFSGTVSDEMDVSVAFISPTNTMTSWAINTRTSAVTEYQNFPFVSFANFGHKYIGASSQGLYELEGATDAGQDVIGSFASGMLQVGDSHFTMFKSAYLGTRQSGDFILKLTTGTGVTYTYGIRSRAMQTTRVNFGKGLRSRYFKYELTAIDGHDFDLDDITFLPIISQRRVD